MITKPRLQIGPIAVFLILSSLFISCEEKEKKQANFFSIDSLVRAQANYLALSGAVLTKHAEINGLEETSHFTPKDTTAWQYELDIFSELKSINKPIHSGSYSVATGVKDPNSNLSIRSFTSTEKLPIVYLKIFYLNELSKIMRIEALYREENSLLAGSRLLILEFQEIANTLVLVSYSIEGGQKMFLGDSVQFSVKGTITFPKFNG
jgi:hypothetical protein